MEVVVGLARRNFDVIRRMIVGGDFDRRLTALAVELLSDISFLSLARRSESPILRTFPLATPINPSDPCEVLAASLSSENLDTSGGREASLSMVDVAKATAVVRRSGGSKASEGGESRA